ncbi:MAG TPA: bifunctional phosphopantothenoylcysteine decarboxylase/phosphopantothenate--cysteine ligase CoaBC [Lactobacillaceae bacterium]|jgi:phosphopantothenoylcysteine decarboxylase/phosphopantothenate--cysteine ligase
MYEDKKIIVYVTGGIAAYKAATLVRALIKAGATVRVAMTRSAQAFITPLTFATLTKHAVLTDDWQADGTVPHIEWAQWADLHFVVPATANVLAKMANGIADDMVTTTLLAAVGDKVVAPAMNDHMWDHPATQRNLAQLAADGVLVIAPAVGFLAEGYEARGRLAEPEEIVAQADVRLLAKTGQLQGKRVVITAGGTQEKLDPVRYLTNRSSGKMGYALAQAAAEAGAEVTLITTVVRDAIFGVKVIEVQSAQMMYDAVLAAFEMADILIAAAAVSDFRPVDVADNKIKKNGNGGLTIELVQNPDILAAVGAAKRADQFVVGFAAETQDVANYAKDKLRKKNADLLIANDVSRADAGFEVDTNQVTLFTENEQVALPLASKLATAREIIAFIANKR